jgi:hypothetical protein
VPVAKGSRPLPLPRNPTGATICLANEPPQKRRPGAHVGGPVARTLLRLIVASPAESAAEDARCGARRPLLVIRFNEPGDGETDVPVVLFDRCRAAYFGSAAFDLPRVLGNFLLDLAGGGDTTAQARLVGMPSAAARRTARDAGRAFVVAGELPDQQSPPGTVLLQSASGREVTVIVAVRPSRPCLAADLTVRYRAGGAAAGMDGGTVIITNRSSTWCELRGPIRFTGLDAAGRPVTETATAQVIANLELAPHPIVGLRAETALSAEYRDDPTAPDGLCERNWVVPTTWRVAIGAETIELPDAGGRISRQVGATGLVTCWGRFAAGRVDLATAS